MPFYQWKLCCCRPTHIHTKSEFSSPKTHGKC